MHKCPRCYSAKFVKNGNHLGSQRYRCKPCGYQFTPNQARRRSPQEKALAILLYTHGLSMNAIGKLLNVTPPAVARWIKSFGQEYARNQRPALIELNEILRYLTSEETAIGPNKLVLILPVKSLARNLGLVITAPHKAGN